MGRMLVNSKERLKYLVEQVHGKYNVTFGFSNTWEEMFEMLYKDNYIEKDMIGNYIHDYFDEDFKYLLLDKEILKFKFKEYIEKMY